MEIIVELGGFASPTVAGDGEVDWIIELRFISGKLEEEVGNFILYLFDASGWFINFINDNNRFEF